MVLALATFSPDLNSVWDQILANAIVPSFDKVFARLLRVSSPSIIRGSSSSSKIESSTFVSQTLQGDCGSRGN